MEITLALVMRLVDGAVAKASTPRVIAAVMAMAVATRVGVKKAQRDERVYASQNVKIVRRIIF